MSEPAGSRPTGWSSTSPSRAARSRRPTPSSRRRSNEPIVVRVNSDVADELHVHSTPDHTFKVEPKQGQPFQFTRRRSRQGRHRAAPPEQDHRHRPSAAVTRPARRGAGPRPRRVDRSADPVHLCAHRCGVGADVHVRRRRARLAQAAIRPGQGRPAAAAVGDDGGRRARDPMGARDRGSAVRGLGGDGRRCSARRTTTTRCPASSTCCCGSAWWRCRWRSGRCGGRSHRCARCTGCCRWRACLPAAAIPAAWATGPRRSGLFAFVWLELASPDPGIARRDQDLAAASTSSSR